MTGPVHGYDAELLGEGVEGPQEHVFQAGERAVEEHHGPSATAFGVPNASLARSGEPFLHLAGLRRQARGTRA